MFKKMTRDNQRFMLVLCIMSLDVVDPVTDKQVWCFCDTRLVTLWLV